MSGRYCSRWARRALDLAVRYVNTGPYPFSCLPPLPPSPLVENLSDPFFHFFREFVCLWPFFHSISYQSSLSLTGKKSLCFRSGAVCGGWVFWVARDGWRGSVRSTRLSLDTSGQAAAAARVLCCSRVWHAHVCFWWRRLCTNPSGYCRNPSSRHGVYAYVLGLGRKGGRERKKERKKERERERWRWGTRHVRAFFGEKRSKKYL